MNIPFVTWILWVCIYSAHLCPLVGVIQEVLVGGFEELEMSE